MTNKKCIVLIFLLFFSFIFTNCNSSVSVEPSKDFIHPDKENDGSTNSKNAALITEDEALHIVMDFWVEHYPVDNIHFSSYFQERNGKEYYAVKIYESLPENDTIATLVIYYVDITNGEMHSFDSELYNEIYLLPDKPL